MTNPCATCRHWRGDATIYRAACAINGNATAFDDGCGAWAGEAKINITIATDTTEAVQRLARVAEDALKLIASVEKLKAVRR